MDLLDKLRAVEKRRARFADGAARPGETVIDRVLGPCEVVVQGRPTLMFGSNNYLGLTLHPDVVDAARQAVVEYGTGTTGSRTANGTLALHDDLERELADWFGKRHAIIFSTGYQANLSLIGALCGAGRRHPDRPRQSREHLRRHAADGVPGDRVPSQFAGEPA